GRRHTRFSRDWSSDVCSSDLPGPAALWIFVALFGAGFGAITPARAALLAELYGPTACGRIGGVMALVLAASRGAAPVGASFLRADRKSVGWGEGVGRAGVGGV